MNKKQKLFIIKLIFFVLAFTGFSVFLIVEPMLAGAIMIIATLGIMGTVGIIILITMIVMFYKDLGEEN